MCVPGVFVEIQQCVMPTFIAVCFVKWDWFDGILNVEFRDCFLIIPSQENEGEERVGENLFSLLFIIATRCGVLWAFVEGFHDFASFAS